MSEGLHSLAAGWGALAVEAVLRTGLAWAVLAALERAFDARRAHRGSGRRAPHAWPEVRLAAWSAVLCAPFLPPVGPRLLPSLSPLGRAELASQTSAELAPALSTLALAACAAWIVGVLVLELHGFVRLSRARRALSALRPAPSSVERRARRIARELGLSRLPALRLLPAGRSPLVVGALRPVLGLPLDLLAAPRARDLERALAHELAHLARRDPWISLALTQLALVAWPSPFAWDARRRAGLALELACDQRVLRLAPEDRAGYRAFLLEHARSLVGEPPHRALALFGRPSALRARLHALERAPVGGPRLRSAAALAVLTLGLVALCPNERPDARHALVERPPGCLQLRFLVLGELARERALATNPPPDRPETDRR